MVLKYPFLRLSRHHISLLANIPKHPEAINHVSDMHRAFEAFPEAVHALSQQRFPLRGEKASLKCVQQDELKDLLMGLVFISLNFNSKGQIKGSSVSWCTCHHVC